MKVVRKNSLLTAYFKGIKFYVDDLSAKLEDFENDLEDHMAEFEKLKDQEGNEDKIEEHLKTIKKLEKENKLLKERNEYLHSLLEKQGITIKRLTKRDLFA
jgi:predicted nuclease with TOPRIM domain